MIKQIVVLRVDDLYSREGIDTDEGDAAVMIMKG